MNDLVLFEFNKPLSQEEFERKGYRDPVCRLEDVTFETKLVAIGCGQDNGKFTNCFLCRLSTSYLSITGSNCELFEQEVHLEEISKCRLVQNQRGVKGLGSSQFCVRVGAAVTPVASDGNQCRKCLIPSTSVLHIKKPNGVYCVAGIATPTTSECDDRVEYLYFTNILGDAVSDFLNLNLKRLSYRHRLLWSTPHSLSLSVSRSHSIAFLFRIHNKDSRQDIWTFTYVNSITFSILFMLVLSCFLTQCWKLSSKQY